jgi:hypothetical protein
LKLLIKDTYFGVTDLNANQLELISERFTYKDSSKAMTKFGYNAKKVKKIKFAIKKNNSLVLRSGFLQEFLLFIKKEQMKIEEVKDNRTRYDFQKKEFSYDELKKYFNPNFKYVDHQIRALKALLKTNCGIIKIPTSGGKCCRGDVKINIEGMGEIEIKDLFNDFSEEEQRIPKKEIKVLTERGYKKIELLYKTNKRNLIEIELENGSKIVAVPEHRVMTNNGWKMIKDLTEEDKVEFYEEEGKR